MIDELWLLDHVDTVEFISVFDALDLLFVEFFIDYVVEHPAILTGTLQEHDALMVDFQRQYQNNLTISVDNLNSDMAQIINALFNSGAREEIATMDEMVKGAELPNIRPAGITQKMESVLLQAKQETMSEIHNYTRTAGNDTYGHYRKLLDEHYLKIMNGKEDFTDAVIRSVREITDRGVTYIAYPSGNRMSVESSARRALLTGVNQATIRMVLEYGDEIGLNTYYVSEHSDARRGKLGQPPYADHFSWQGVLYVREELVSVCGWGTGEGLGGWNCRHHVYLYIAGFTKIKTLKEQSATRKKEKWHDEKRKLYNDVRRKERNVQALSQIRGFDNPEFDHDKLLKEYVKRVRELRESKNIYEKY